MVDPNGKMSNGEISVYYMESYSRYIPETDSYDAYKDFDKGWTSPIFRFDDRGRYYPSDYNEMEKFDYK